MAETSIFRGLSAFPLTPADADGVVDTEAFARMLDRLVAAGVDSIAVLGSTGTYAYLERSERSRALAAAVETVAGRVPLIAGIGAMRTSWVRELAGNAERMGADGLLLAPVSYTPLTQDEVFGQFEAVSTTSGLPICIYNNPSTTHFTFSAELIGRLSRLANIAAIKMPLPADGNFEGEIGLLRSSCQHGITVGYSGDWGAASALLAGADAWYSVVAGLLPAAALRLTRAAIAGDHDATHAANAAFEPLWSLFRAHGSLRVMYLIADQLGLQPGAPPLPIQPLAGSVGKVVEGALQLIERSAAIGN
ncbi:dihydrodipicolinate synthase family protein [Bosea sp. F3-2]|uniref:dihydrodipicolinate synthase family protein n=1 Tax=Bosea sp. F3-2 TaxID=2599640 RepID=UPI0011EFCC97|nr:dihydrodipicolinate synthase family protein [Bosea sp. F3-2]QEL22340.1 dihydrodipicolinate synthase family protein [Bosea sp. F3-2]